MQYRIFTHIMKPSLTVLQFLSGITETETAVYHVRADYIRWAPYIAGKNANLGVESGRMFEKGALVLVVT